MSSKNIRMKDVLARLDDTSEMSATEYIAMLKGIRKNCVCQMWMKSYHGTDDGLQVYANSLDKVHWLIDSVEKHTPVSDGVSIDFELPPVEASA